MRTPGLALAASLVAAAAGGLAACGQPATPPPTAAAPTAAPAPTATPEAAASAAPVVTAAPTVNPAPARQGDSTPVGPSRFVEDARRLGVDWKRPLAQLPLAAKKKLMPLFVRSLGYESCSGCHLDGDFKTDTRNMKIARKMWDHFLVGMRDARGEPLFCDSCHAGKARVLDRGDAGDQRAIKLFMETEYKGKLTRADGNDNGCGVCHGYPLEGRIIEKLWGISAK